MSLMENLSGSGIFKRSATNGFTINKINHTKTVVRNGDEVFFAHGSVLRYCNLSRGSKYQILDTNSIDFDVNGLVLNASGSLLAAYNSSKVVVIPLSLSHFNSSNTDFIQVKSFVVGKTVYGEHSNVIEVTWNSIARFDSGLVILSSDGNIRAFDIRTSIDVPEISYQISSYGKNKIGLTKNSIENPVSMCFGSDDDLAGALSLYILDKDGDIFTIYPFMPKQIAVPREYVEGLFNESLLVSNSSTTTSAKITANQQLRFVTGLWNQLSTSQKEIRGTTELCVLNNEKIEEYFIQGPLAVQPFPNALYDDYGVNISTMKLGHSDMLVVSYLKNGILTLSLDSDLIMKWSSNEDLEDYLMVNDSESEFSTLSVVEHIKLGTGFPSEIGQIVDQFVIYVQSGDKIFSIDISKWGSLLDQSVALGESDEMIELLNGPSLGTKIELVLQLEQNELIEGLAAVNDENGRSEVILVTDRRTEIVARHPQLQPKTSEVEQDKVQYKSLLTGPYGEILKLLKPIDSIKLSSKEHRGTVFSADDFFLRELNGVSTQALRYIVDFHKLGLSLNSRLISQKQELGKQLSKTYELSELSHTLKEKALDNKTVSLNIISRQEKIDKRFNELAQKLKGSVDLPLSEREKSWFKEVKDLTLFFNKAVKRNNDLKQQLSYITSELQAKASLQTQESVADSQNWEELNKIINEGKALLEHTSKELKDTSSQFDNHVKEVRL